MNPRIGQYGSGQLGFVAHLVALLILVRAEGPEGVAVPLVDRRTGQTKEKGIGQRVAHLATQVAFLGAVRLVHHHDDVRALVQAAVRLAELVNGGDDDLAGIGRQQALQLLPGGSSDHVRNIGGIEGGGDLGVQIDAVHYDHHRGVAELAVHTQLLRREHHQQRLARALEMPDQALLGIALDHAGHHQVSAFVLLITADDLDAPVLLVGGEQGEILQDVQHHMGAQHGTDGTLHVRKRSLGLVLALVPRPPDIDGHAHRAVAIALALGGKGEDVGHEHLRHALFIAVVNVAGPVHPGHRRAHRRLGLADHQRDAIDQHNDVEAAAAFLDRIDPLVGDHVIVVAEILEVDQAHRRVFTALAEGHGLLAPQPFGEQLVGPHQTFALYRQRNGPQAVGLGLDFRVQADEGVAHHRLHQHVGVLTGQLLGGHEAPFKA